MMMDQKLDENKTKIKWCGVCMCVMEKYHRTSLVHYKKFIKLNQKQKKKNFNIGIAHHYYNINVKECIL